MPSAGSRARACWLGFFCVFCFVSGGRDSKAIPLDENEGIYVRDMKTGRIRAIAGESYMLKENEELWNKDLPAEVEELLNADALVERNAQARRDRASSASLQRA